MGSHQLLNAIAQAKVLGTRPDDVGGPILGRSNLDGGTEDRVEVEGFADHDYTPERGTSTTQCEFYTRKGSPNPKITSDVGRHASGTRAENSQPPRHGPVALGGGRRDVQAS